MSDVRLTMAVCDYDRTRALFDGRVKVEGCDVTAVPLEPEEAFHRAFKYQEFDVTEMSISSHTLMVSREANHYVGIPAFVSRLFRHSGIYIRTDRGIKSPQDLVGKKIGLPEYQITANVWIRGFLQDEYGVRPEQIHWRRGGIEEAGRGERAPIKLPATVDLQQIPDHKTLSGMLESGEIDGMITARAPSCFDRRVPNVGRLFPDFKAAEQDYFKRTGIFPIMHLIGIRKSLVEKYPWLPVNVYNAFLQSKKIAMKELNELAQLLVNLPWVVAHYDETRAVMGEDFWPYGFPENRKQIEAFTRYSYDQGLSSRLVAPEELFAASTFDLSKI